MNQPIVIWKSQLPRCFKKFQDTSRPANVNYFSNPKSWMTSEVMEAPLVRFNKKLAFEHRKVILFIDNATCHPESMDWPVFVYQSYFITKEYNFVATTTRCWHHSKFESSTKRDWLSMCSQGSSRMHLQHKLSRVWMYLWLFDDYKKRGKK